jgi:hypothetical protein
MQAYLQEKIKNGGLKNEILSAWQSLKNDPVLIKDSCLQNNGMIFLSVCAADYFAVQPFQG